MARVALVTDSTSDMPRPTAAEVGVTVVPLTLTLDGTSYRDGIDITTDEFYRRLTASSGIATTSQPSPGAFAEIYEELLRTHDEILSLHISSTLSGTVSSAQQAADLVAKDRITVVDTHLVSMALGLGVYAGLRILQDGATAQDAASRLQGVLGSVRVYCMVDTLEYLRRGGRIGRAGALVGSVLQVKPVLTLQDGTVSPLERVRTRERALRRVIELAEQTSPRLCAIVGQALAQESAERISNAIAERCESLLQLPLGPIVGTHAGPGTVGLACYPAELLPLGLGVQVGAGRS
ncbi:MAG: DegV family protein [Candidatus Dormiibacterota bacterium]